MPRSNHVRLALNMHDSLQTRYRWDKANAWQGIARLLLTCDVWKDGWRRFRDVVVYRESNDFGLGPNGVAVVLQPAEELFRYLALELGILHSNLCREIGPYWRHPGIVQLQPHNLLGNTFRSRTVHILQTFGDRGITYSEEVSPHDELPGQRFETRSPKARIDIVARRGNTTVALVSSRWRFRHDRVDVVEEALVYTPAARRHNPACRFYASVGGFNPARLHKILSNCPSEQPYGTLAAAVHFAPRLISRGLGENGRIAHLQSLKWLIDQTFLW